MPRSLVVTEIGEKAPVQKTGIAHDLFRFPLFPVARVEPTICYLDPNTEVAGTDQFLLVSIFIFYLLLFISPRYNLLRALAENFLSCRRPSEDC